MPEADLIELFARPLNEVGALYLVSGSVAAMLHGEPRLTHGIDITLAPPEYVILRKLEYYREGGSEKHLRDIRSMLAIAAGQIERGVLDEWIKKRNLQNQWNLVSS